ncbi:MAG TPA: HipA N-terminal domain-containing protein [Mycobacteriales bacterium]|nr:HipA N-terminal domain-containing protein [Mycobacteriales bacterium]
MAQPSDEDLQQLRTVDRADVVKAGRHAATLSRTAAGVEFRYLNSWITDGGPAVATTLPLTAGPVTRPGGAHFVIGWVHRRGEHPAYGPTAGWISPRG